MNKMIVIALGTVVALSSTAALAAPKPDLNVNSVNRGAATAATGKDSTASTGSINLKGTSLRNSKINVTSQSDRARTTASGENSTAATGSALIKGSKFK